MIPSISSVTVTTPATFVQLTTPAAVVAAMGEGDPADPVIVSAVADASSVISGYCGGRVFAREVVTETWRLSRRVDMLKLRRRPVTTIASVTASDAVLAAGNSGYELLSDEGYLFRLSGGGIRCSWQGGVIVVAYTGGWLLPGNTTPNLPERYQRAATLTAIEILSSSDRDPALRSIVTEGVGSYTYDTTVGAAVVPPEAAALLSDARDMGV